MPTILKSIPIEPSFFDSTGQSRFSWLGMAGVLLNARGLVLLIDPLIAYGASDQESEEGFPLSIQLPIEAHQVPRTDWVLYTHADEDHLGRLTAQTLARQTSCRFLAPPPVADILRGLGIAAERIVIARDFAAHDFGPVQVQVTPALHDWQETNPWQRGDCCGYLLKTPDGTIWHPGDTRLIDELLDVPGVDILLFDVAAVDSHLGSEGSARLAVTSGARLLIPYHYGTFAVPPGSFGGFDPEDALPYLDGVPARFQVFNPGEVLHLPVD